MVGMVLDIKVHYKEKTSKTKANQLRLSFSHTEI